MAKGSYLGGSTIIRVFGQPATKSGKAYEQLRAKRERLLAQEMEKYLTEEKGIAELVTAEELRQRKNQRKKALDQARARRRAAGPAATLKRGRKRKKARIAKVFGRK